MKKFLLNCLATGIYSAIATVGTLAGFAIVARLLEKNVKNDLREEEHI